MSAGPRAGVPDTEDLVEAVLECLRNELLPGLGGRDRYLVQVCVAALEIVQREAALGPALADAERTFRAETGTPDDATLVAELRAGVSEERLAHLVAALTRRNRVDVAVARPDALEAQSSGRQ